MIKLRRIFIFLVLIFQGFVLLAQVRLPQLISDGMVLQRDAKINIWGWASPRERVSLKFMGRHYQTAADNSGKWVVILDKAVAGGPYTMDIDASNHFVVNDIMIGDVWFCSGQSNMVLPMDRVREKYPDEIKNANYSQIRNFFVPTLADVTKEHADLPKGIWQQANALNMRRFGAASYFFAKKLFEKYHVPIGLINSSVGGTPIQAWISRQGLKDISIYANRAARLRDSGYLNKLLDSSKRTTDDPAFAKPIPGSIDPKIWADTAGALPGRHKREGKSALPGEA